ncbi:hypothetical protein G6F70_001208 [Rhizopus microsporus]|uniref:Uncharacterized protein n=2 Tax=Rhizopus TaxID=4842 RepID=A0A367JHM0_RHIAZ|nr:hypothetical protein G6F71_005871 [Rhizopus microsporus]RCH89448.1 hypothetical protein CU097_006771 [Rhizopus azygosporus]KAG1203618.1 hypothetical protein G6F70_001208 [Rhizopus microsporus]KAG1213938.1 hypothetical protein G6F69_002385 [Rhizopus microsporus]KAG1231618.1 hypothetical protein G6F67_005618 [Rhizopus microsporus]
MTDSSEDHILAGTTLVMMVHRSPHRIMLMRNKYHEIDSSMTTLLNQDWDPEAKYVYAQLLAGAILLSSNGETILINTIEIYGRTKTIDIHREMNSGESTIPPETLHISILDVAESSKVGPVSSTFDVDCRTKIYVDKWSMEMATKLNNMNGRSVESFHYVYRARQTRSNFSLPKPRIIS